MKIDLFEFLKNGLSKLDFDGKLELTQNKEQYTLTIEMTFVMEKRARALFLEMTGETSPKPAITFVDAILLYDRYHFDPAKVQDEYLTCLPFEGTKGWEVAKAEALLTYLQILLDNSQSDLIDFLNSSDSSELTLFELEWSDEEFSRILAQKQQAQDRPLWLPYSE
ncbi:DUF3013 family protein [Liquorilactobacillus oeni]|uniref:DUF3013 family protein n=1 Tax=Liquorilactobacillus oeni DSM 19972 TaxID=1423777 RepID=A0A0R1MEJ8_9LACO|nr:DUF3013 family protein [Liquorilactobacillus oeni]KRL04292.1 hypothetical protein FD46_GL001417 [Liquorilactobacillus oeni DSM 19972]